MRTPIFNLIVAIVAALIAAYVIPWLRARTTQAERDELLAWVDIAVMAAEQLFKGKGRGQEKLDFAIEFLRSRGFSVDVDSLRTLVEATVLQLNSTLKEQKNE